MKAIDNPSYLLMFPSEMITYVIHVIFLNYSENELPLVSCLQSS